jgi:uncharacterized protein
MRLLLWAVILFALVMLVLHIKKAVIRNDNAARENSAPRRVASEAMVQCAHCGIHIPASEALPAQSGEVFCSEEHRLKQYSR